MLDARPGVAKEAADLWLNRTFSVPLSFRPDAMSEQREQRISDLHDAIHDCLPRGERTELHRLANDARKWLVERSKSMTWPTPAEVHEAFRAARPKAAAEGQAVTEYIVTSTADWVRKFNDWPGYLTDHVAVARILVERGEFTREEIIAAGFPKHLMKRDPNYDPEKLAEIGRQLGEAKRMNTGLV